MSSSSPWFHGWLARDPAFDGYFLEPGESFDVSHVVRPRTTPLVHEYVRPDGSAARAWTTFGPDQVDIDPSTPAVLLDLTDVLLGYLAHGATTVRLDAIGYLWKESGSTCIHLPQTHAIIRIWRVLVDALAPGTLLLTETNVPHADNITYFGDGSNEAHMVYQFALPPLVLHAFVTGQATALAAWASGIGPVSPTATWFNFLASHDGIGIRPTEGLLTDDDRTLLVERTLARGGRVSMARRPDGSEGVYELNTNYLDALVDPENRIRMPPRWPAGWPRTRYSCRWSGCPRSTTTRCSGRARTTWGWRRATSHAASTARFSTPISWPTSSFRRRADRVCWRACGISWRSGARFRASPPSSISRSSRWMTAFWSSVVRRVPPVRSPRSST